MSSAKTRTAIVGSSKGPEAERRRHASRAPCSSEYDASGLLDHDPYSSSSSPPPAYIASSVPAPERWTESVAADVSGGYRRLQPSQQPGRDVANPVGEGDIPAGGFLVPGCSGNARGVDLDKAREKSSSRAARAVRTPFPSYSDPPNYEYTLPPTRLFRPSVFPPMACILRQRHSLGLVSISPRIRPTGETVPNSRAPRVARPKHRARRSSSLHDTNHAVNGT